mmetsp:Transcript_29765/g.75701  ORF Transcript_29765/g.75701 Transcript_29765/m.75701 type:complete len:272 (+) Transcript_29765:384-1199(+)
MPEVRSSAPSSFSPEPRLCCRCRSSAREAWRSGGEWSISMAPSRRSTIEFCTPTELTLRRHSSPSSMISSYALCWRMVPSSSGTPREERMASWPSAASEMLRRTPSAFCCTSSDAAWLCMMPRTTTTPWCATTLEMPAAEIVRFHSMESAFFCTSSSASCTRITRRMSGTPPSLMMCAWPSLVLETSHSMSMTLSSMALLLGCCCIVPSSTATIAGPSCRNALQWSSESHRFQSTPSPFLPTSATAAYRRIARSTSETPPSFRMHATPALE